jgi:hypothetical protein
MKVIAINNAPDILPNIEWVKKFNLERAYFKYDIFDTKTIGEDELVIYNHHIQEYMEVIQVQILS